MQSKINRRKFIQNSALGSVGMFIAPSLASASSIFSAVNENKNILMAGLTPISVIDNACMLAFRSGKLSLKSQELVTADIHFNTPDIKGVPGNKGRLSVVMPTLDKKLIELVKTIKSNTETKHIHEKRAIAFGWAAINAVQKHINQPIQGKSTEEAIRIRLHQDALIIQGFSSPEYYVQGANYKDIEDMLNSMLVRTITRVHTLKPDSDDGIGWVNRMAAWRRNNVKIMKEFARAIVSPDEKIAGESFYNDDDKIIDFANKLQKAQNIASIDIIAAVENTGSSNYAKALAEATRSIFAIDDFLNDKITVNLLMDKLNLG